MNEPILALDLATKTGWAHSIGQSGMQDFSPRRGDSPGMRYLEFGGWLRRLLDSSPAEVIAYEMPHQRGGAATQIACGLVSQVQLVAAERGLETTQRHTSKIKKHATGSGNAGKPQMVGAARKRWPDLTIVDDNHADALWLLDLVQSDLGANQ